MIDLHCHALPGLDDGPTDLDGALALCQAAAREGTEAIVATPHHRHPLWANEDRALLRRRRDELARALGATERPRLLLGAEIRVDSTFLDDLERMPRQEAPSLAGSRYLLLEFDRGPRPEIEPLALVHELSVAGWFPILAHPEFVPWLADDLPLAAALVERGALLQVTAMSVVGDFGRWPAQACRDFLAAGLVHFVASDAHGAVRRPPGLERARRAVSQAFGEDLADRIFRIHPECVLADRPLPRATEAPEPLTRAALRARGGT